MTQLAESEAVLGAPAEGLGAQRYAFEEDADVTLSARRGLQLDWQDCAEGFQCADAFVPRDYERPHGPTLRLAVTRLPARDAARRIGALFVNFGGPGGDAVASLHSFGRDLFAELNARFDIVGFDPRGTGDSEGAIDCGVDQATQGLYAQPFTTPVDFDRKAWLERARHYVDACIDANGDALSHTATASVARDMDLLRAAVGDDKLTFLGFSYGTFLGATYAALFPRRYRALVLDGALDADVYMNRPMLALQQQTAGFERALDRFFEACAANQTACSGFGGSDPHLAFDRLVAAANQEPMPVVGIPRPVNGDDILWASSSFLYAKQAWPFLAEALADAEAGDATQLRLFADGAYGRRDDGTFDPSIDRYFALSAAEQRYDADVDLYADGGAASHGLFDHYFWNTGYSELPLGLFPVRAEGAFYGPFVASESAPTILVVATTYDPATPYRGSERLVDQLGNARLLTMLGDGHTAYGGNSPCIDTAVDTYLETGTLPAVGTACQQDAPFVEPEPEPAATLPAASTGAALGRLQLRFHRALR